MHIIDGKALASHIESTVRTRAQALEHPPTLAVLLVGDDKASHLYVSMKKKRAHECGITVHVEERSANTTQDELIAIIQTWNADSSIDGILVQVPLPEGFSEDAVIAAIDPTKDVDGFHPTTVASLMQGEPTLISPVHEGILRLIATTPLALTSKTAVIIANSTIFSDPLAHLLKTAGLFVHTMHPDEINKATLRRADIVVIAIGRAKWLHAGMTADHAIIIDVGTNKDAQGVLCGDVDMATYFDREDVYVTPVPGGVGPMTIAQLLHNTTLLAERRA